MFEHAEGREAADALSVVRAYNSRPLGSPGWRRVRLQLLSGEEVTRTFTVVNLWDGSGETARTLFHLEEPEGLKGTSYLLTEDGGAVEGDDMKVHLFLPAGERRVLEVVPSEFDEGLLGSDFAYTDVRMRLPLQGYEYRTLGQAVLSGESVWVVESRPFSEGARRLSSWDAARYYFAKGFPFMLGADYLMAAEKGGEAARPVKRMRVESFKQEGGFWTATRMVIYAGGGNSSVLTLKDICFGVGPLDGRILTPAELSRSTELLRRLDGCNATKPPAPRPSL